MGFTGTVETVVDRKTQIVAVVFLLIAAFVIVQSFIPLPIEDLEIGQSLERVNEIFPEHRYERIELVRADGGQVLVLFRNGIRDDERELLSEVPQPLDKPNDLPYIYAKIIISFDPEGLVDGYSWDGEGPSAGTVSGGRNLVPLAKE